VRRISILVGLAMAGLLGSAATVSGHERRTPRGKPGHRHSARHHRHTSRRRSAHHGRRHRRGRHHKRPVHGPQGSPKPPAPGPTPPPGNPGSAKIQHVVWILMENQNYSSIIGSGSAPYINSLANTYGLATNYSAISHPSLPNYIALTSGSDQGITDDNDPSSHPLNVPSIFSQLPGGASRSLEENMPSDCAQSNSGEYAVRHNPEAYYTNLGSACGSYDVPLGSTPDVSARFTFVTPNLINDMHDGTIADGDNYLKSFVPAVMATPQYQSGQTAIFIVWDENSGTSGNQVPCIVVSPYTHGVKDGTPYTHYSLLRTTEELLGLPLLANAASANSMVGKFGF
jgi:phosphatidylinositol-3-phosphatase